MKTYQVTRAFLDKETGLPYSLGDTYQTEDDSRAKTLQAGGFIAGGNVSNSDTPDTPDTPKGKGKAIEKPAENGKPSGETKSPEADKEKPAAEGGK